VIAGDPPRERSATYEAFVAGESAHLRRILVAHFGTDVGAEVTADALTYAWEHWDRVEAMSNRVGYLYRVGQSSARRHWRWRRPLCLPPEEQRGVGAPEPGLPAALAELPDGHRVAVLLVHAHGYSYEEAAAMQGVPVSTIRNHVHRGMVKLRALLGATDDA
jgi:DNA-directed RNA polymerase specialized sigma24 family protein